MNSQKQDQVGGSVGGHTATPWPQEQQPDGAVTEVQPEDMSDEAFMAEIYASEQMKIRCHDDLVKALQSFVVLVEDDTIRTTAEGRTQLIAALTRANAALAKVGAA